MSNHEKGKRKDVGKEKKANKTFKNEHSVVETLLKCFTTFSGLQPPNKNSLSFIVQIKIYEKVDGVRFAPDS
jgi:hypothetical protein